MKIYLAFRGVGVERISFTSTLSKVLFFTLKVWGFSGCTFFDTCNPQIKTALVENDLNIPTCNCLERRYYGTIRVKYLWRGYPNLGLGIPNPECPAVNPQVAASKTTT